MEKAKNELGECAESRKIKLRLLEERVVQDKDIPNARRDDAFLLRFLRAKKFDVDKSFRMVFTIFHFLFLFFNIIFAIFFAHTLVADSKILQNEK